MGRIENPIKTIVRNGLYFYFVDNVLTVSLGKPNEPESEHVLSIHSDFLPALIAGLKASSKGAF